MRVTILPSADRDLDDIYDWIAEDDPDAAARHVRRLTAAALNLREFPMRGMARPEIGEGARSLVVGRYLVLYRVSGERVEIVRFVHGAREVGGVLPSGLVNAGPALALNTGIIQSRLDLNPFQPDSSTLTCLKTQRIC